MSTTRGLAARSPIGGLGRWVAVVAAAGSMWAAPTLAAAIWSRTDWSPGRKLHDLLDAYTHLFAPQQIDGSGVSGPGFAVTTIAVLAAAAVAGTMAAVRVTDRRAAVGRGLGQGRDLDRFSRRAIVERSKVILGALDRDPTRSGVLVGKERFSGREIWLPKESTLLVLAPPRSGKTSGTVAPAVVDHHGPVVATGVRDDIMVWTHPWRALRGVCAVCL